MMSLWLVRLDAEVLDDELLVEVSTVEGDEFPTFDPVRLSSGESICGPIVPAAPVVPAGRGDHVVLLDRPVVSTSRTITPSTAPRLSTSYLTIFP